MAEIPVEKKSRLPWWLWAALAVVVLLVLFLLLSGDRDETGAASSEPAGSVGAEPSASPPNVAQGVEFEEPAAVIRSLAVLSEGTPELAGRQVEIEGVTVERMYGDRGFTVTNGESTPVFVVLDEAVPGPDSGADGDVNVDAGQTIDMTGVVYEVIDGRVEGQPIEDLPADVDVFVYASDVRIEE